MNVRRKRVNDKVYFTYLFFLTIIIMIILTSCNKTVPYRDRRLTTNFEFWVEIFCVPTCFHVRIPKPCLSVCPSVCPYPEKRNYPGFVNINPTLVIDTSMERSSRVLQHGNTKIWFFLKFEIEFWLVFWLVPKGWNHSSRSQHEPIWRHRGCIVVP